jgi:type VI secretion system protein VasJ
MREEGPFRLFFDKETSDLRGFESMSEPNLRAALGSTPIPGDHPAGHPIADDPAYEALRREIMKEPAKGEQTDWAKVVELGSLILREKSKDVASASYLAVGLLNTQGFAGLLDGLRIVEGLLLAHWDQAFPPVPSRLRGRANAIQYLSDACVKLIGLREPKAAEREELLGCLQACADFEKVLQERFTDAPVSVGALTSALRERMERLPKEAGAQASTPGTSPTGEARPVVQPAGSLSSGELTSRAEAEQLVMKSAAFFRQKEPTNPVAYRLARVLRWGNVLAAPAVVDGKTQLIDPPAERISGLRSLFEKGDWAGLLAAAEDAFRERPLWVDAQRYSDRALAGLGGPYAGARQGLVDEVRSLLRRLPSLPSLLFQNGTPFADADTKKWLLEEVGADEPAPRASTAVAAAPDSAEIVAAREEARELARKGRLPHALGKLDEALITDQSARGRFLARLELATLASEAGKERIAAPLFDALDNEMQRHDLEQWEPALALRVLEALYRCRKRLAERRGASPEDAVRAETVFARICRVDPVAAAALE